MILHRQYGNMVGIINVRIEPVPLKKVAGKLKKVDPDNSMIREVKAVGISFGDE